MEHREWSDRMFRKHWVQEQYIFLRFSHCTLKEVLVSNSRVHKCEESLLTSTSGFDNYRGLVNLCLVLLVRKKKFGIDRSIPAGKFRNFSIAILLKRRKMSGHPGKWKSVLPSTTRKWWMKFSCPGSRSVYKCRNQSFCILYRLLVIVPFWRHLHLHILLKNVS